jgi:hypothetical protein
MLETSKRDRAVGTFAGSKIVKLIKAGIELLILNSDPISGNRLPNFKIQQSIVLPIAKNNEQKRTPQGRVIKLKIVGDRTTNW